ncbi:putative oxidoreductase [Klebsiella pneumoniae]|uniref:Putative oxidoreductase n=1 Tax=Klebsiella pneumoniae TaxID=573 RepID=A0A377TMK3_KLEPN|nr:putative oxidoreductase [Klebsiella pneumoniae]
MMQMRGGALAQLDNTRRTGHGYDERITLLGAEGALESGSQSPAGPTLWRGNQRIEPGLWPDWFSRVHGSYYQHLDAFIRSLNGETVADLPAAGRPAGAGHCRSGGSVPTAWPVCRRRRLSLSGCEATAI